MHGFAFAMLIGVLVGTYSSIAIAAPILLIGDKSAPDSDAGSDLAVTEKDKAPDDNAAAIPSAAATTS